MTRIKLCGFSTLETVEAANRLNVDFLGFVAYPPSPRHVEAAHYATLAKALAPTTHSALVTVDADDATLDRYIHQHSPAYLQCHGNESPERLAMLKQRYGIGIIKSLAVQSHADLVKAAQYSESSDFLLLDAKPTQNELPGGNARSFDWTLLAGQQFSLPWFLSGGLTPENIADALHATHAPLVDVSSGIESAKGVKDPQRMQHLIAAINAYDKQPPSL